MQSEKQSKKIKKVLGEFKDDKLKSFDGKKVTKKKQAVAIALSEAGVQPKRKSKGGLLKRKMRMMLPKW